MQRCRCAFRRGQSGEGHGSGSNSRVFNANSITKLPAAPQGKPSSSTQLMMAEEEPQASVRRRAWAHRRV